MKEAPGSSETSVLTRATRRNIPEDTILQRTLFKRLKKIKKILLAGHGAIQGCEMLRIPYFLDNKLRDGGVDVSLTRWPYFTHQKGFLAINSVKG
jgi:hypothetical protein